MATTASVEDRIGQIKRTKDTATSELSRLEGQREAMKRDVETANAEAAALGLSGGDPEEVKAAIETTRGEIQELLGRAEALVQKHAEEDSE